MHVLLLVYSFQVEEVGNHQIAVEFDSRITFILSCMFKKFVEIKEGYSEVHDLFLITLHKNL